MEASNPTAPSATPTEHNNISSDAHDDHQSPFDDSNAEEVQPSRASTTATENVEAPFNTAEAEQTAPAASVDHDASSDTESENPDVATLKSMFPDFDSGVLGSVLESVNGDQSRAVEVLLGMSDPDYVPAEEPSNKPHLSQTDLDEQLARRLMLEEQQQSAQYSDPSWQPQQQQQQQRGRYYDRAGPGQLPRLTGSGPNTRGPGERDTMQDLQEQFTKIAETGKKKFGNLFTKVKAKMQEFDQPRQPQPQAGSSASYESYVGRPTTPSSQSYYDPRAASSNSNPYPVNPTAGSNTVPRTNTYASYSQGATAAPPTSSAPIVQPTTATSYSTLQAPALTSQISENDIMIADNRSPPPPTTAQGPPTTTSNIDYSKIGLLPKRPISLVAADPAPRRREDDDELEYEENPFEESTRH